MGSLSSTVALGSCPIQLQSSQGAFLRPLRPVLQRIKLNVVFQGPHHRPRAIGENDLMWNWQQSMPVLQAFASSCLHLGVLSSLNADD